MGQWLGSVFGNGDEKTKRLVDRLDELINGQNEAIIDSTWLLLNDVRYELELCTASSTARWSSNIFKLSVQTHTLKCRRLSTPTWMGSSRTVAFGSKENQPTGSGSTMSSEIFSTWVVQEWGRPSLQHLSWKTLKKIAERDHISVAFFFVQGNNKSLQDMVDISKALPLIFNDHMTNSAAISSKSWTAVSTCCTVPKNYGKNCLRTSGRGIYQTDD